jgi:hypothetical protein
MSYNAVALGRGKPYYDPHFCYVEPPDQKPQPGYYAVLPLTVPMDAATLPFQGIMYGVMCFSASALAHQEH